jgi:hypothetical protein
MANLNISQHRRGETDENQGRRYGDRHSERIPPEYKCVSKRFRTDSITKYMLTTMNSH